MITSSTSAFDGSRELDLFINTYDAHHVILSDELYSLTGINTDTLNSEVTRLEENTILKTYRIYKGRWKSYYWWHNGKSFDSYFIRALRDESLILRKCDLICDTYLWARYDLKLKSMRTHSAGTWGWTTSEKWKHLALQDSKMLFHLTQDGGGVPRRPTKENGKRGSVYRQGHAQNQPNIQEFFITLFR